MDKVFAFLGKVKSSLTMWAMAAIALLDQIQPVAQWINDTIAKVAPGKSAAVIAVLALITRSRSLITSALASLKAGAPPAA